jgi:hypothetical protein
MPITRRTPGVYTLEAYPTPPPVLHTGVPVFLGLVEAGRPIEQPTRIGLWPEFLDRFGGPREDAYLGVAVRGFYANEGRFCHVVGLREGTDPTDALAAGLDAIEELDADLVCVPDLPRLRAPGEAADAAVDLVRLRALQQAVVDYCDQVGHRVALLDSAPGAGAADVQQQRHGLTGTNAALYYPWVRPYDWPVPVPPCGHVAGVVAHTDERVGVHKAPANDVLDGVLDLEHDVTEDDHGLLNPIGVNCIRAFRGRGIRVFGARTIADDPAWRYLNVRRLFLTAARWLELTLGDIAFEANDAGLWARVEREVSAYFEELYRRGALRGASPEEAFYVKCDAETNPADSRDVGRVVTEIGLAPALPNEFVVVTIVHQPGGVSVLGPVRPS